VERRLFKAKANGLQFNRLPRDRSIEIVDRLEKLRRNPKGELLPEGQLSRDLDEKEHAFIRSERLLCKGDFSYYLTRYHAVERDPGVGDESGVGPAKPLQSQLRMIQLIGRREEECFAEVKKYKFTEGILCYCHKCRQVAFTATSRAMAMHRMLFYPGSRCFSAALNEDGQGELYKRDKLTLENWPWWLKPGKDYVYPDVKNTELGFITPFASRMTYQAENQQTGIGTGTQQDISHLTEVPLWNYPERIRFSFLPSIPKAVTTLHIQEGTSAGKGGYWQEVSEGCRKRLRGYEPYIYIFVPWYVNATKYRSNAPDNWKPEQHTVKHAELIARTSPEFCDGVSIIPTRSQMYWWETTRTMYARDNELGSFLASYPATPEQSFVNNSQGALPIELLEELEMSCRTPRPYEIQVAA
jgi:hypothetical protein